MRIDIVELASHGGRGDLDNNSLSEVVGAKAPLKWAQRTMDLI